jgi:hypothetical protein
VGNHNDQEMLIHSFLKVPSTPGLQTRISKMPKTLTQVTFSRKKRRLAKPPEVEAKHQPSIRRAQGKAKFNNY